MKYLILFLSIMIIGCTPSNKLNLAKARYLCYQHGGLYKFSSLSEYPVICRSGKRYSLQDLSTVEIPTEYIDQFYQNNHRD